MGTTSSSGVEAPSAAPAALPQHVTPDAPSPALAPPPGNPRFPLFDSFRGVCILTILAFHSMELTGTLGNGLIGRAIEAAGPVAVVIFFTVSGFLLYRPYVSARLRGRPLPSTRLYARRRALRILPCYWVTLTVLAIFPGIIGVFSGDWWRYYGYLQVYAQRTQNGGIPVAWTLCVEITFYLLLPVWAYAIRRLAHIARPRDVLLAELLPLGLVAAGGTVVQMAVADHRAAYVLTVTILGQCPWIVVGMMLAVTSVAAQHDDSMFRRLRGLADRPGLCWLLAVAPFAGLVALVPSGGLRGLLAAAGSHQSLATTFAKVPLSAAVVALFVLPAIFGDQTRGLPRRFLASRIMISLGVVSYSFYLYHLTIAELFASAHSSAFSAGGVNLVGHVHAARSLVLYVVTLVTTGLVAAVSYRVVELPFLRRKEIHPAPR